VLTVVVMNGLIYAQGDGLMINRGRILMARPQRQKNGFESTVTSMINPLKINLIAYMKPNQEPEDRQKMVAEAAYYQALKRNFEGGDPLEDWLVAEREIRSRLTSE